MSIRPETAPGSSPEDHDEPLVFDRRAALARLDGVEEYLTLLINTFLASSEEDLAAIRAGIADGNIRTVQRAAHRLKGSSGYFQIDAYQRRIAAFEMAARAGDSEAVLAQWPAMERCHQRLLEVLRQSSAGSDTG